MDYITAEINDVDKMIETMISSNNPNFENAVQFLCTIPDAKCDSAITINFEIGTDMSQISNSKRLCCGLDLCPAAINLLIKRSLSGLHMPESTLNLH